MNSNKFETGTLRNVTGSCIKPTKFSKNIAYTLKRIDSAPELTEQNRSDEQLTDEENEKRRRRI